MAEEQAQEQQSLQDQAKALWAKFAGKLGVGDEEMREFTFGVSKKSYITAIILFVISMLIFGAGAYFIWNKNEELIARTRELKNLSQYDLKDFLDSEVMASEKDRLSSIDQMADLYTSSKNEKEQIEGDLNFKISVYNEFLRNILLPSLNIWKDPYTKEVDIDILGRKYLDVNPYQDISLLSQWSSIIRDSGKDVGTNQVTDMKIGEIEEETEKGYFKIPITVSFKSNSKRAFLLLVDKLSLTSNVNNLGLLNDFTYTLFGVIREEKADEIQKLITEYGTTKPDNVDEKYFDNMIISRYLYNRTFGEKLEECRLINDEIIDLTIKKNLICGDDMTEEGCYFLFREKYRNIPELAYSIGLKSVVNKTLALKKFYSEIPPLIAIKSFSFDKQNPDSLTLSNSVEYVGDVSFNIYGRELTNDEVEEITKKLAESCFGSGSTNNFEIDSVLDPIQKKIEKMEGNKSNSNIEDMSNYIELRDILNEDKKSNQQLTPYNSMIRKFEYYRMLKNAGICDGAGMN